MRFPVDGEFRRLGEFDNRRSKNASLSGFIADREVDLNGSIFVVHVCHDAAADRLTVYIDRGPEDGVDFLDCCGRSPAMD